MLLIPARIKQLKDEGREQGRKEGREQGRKEGREQGRKEGREQGIAQAREEMRQRLAQAMARFGYTDRGHPVLPFTPEIQRFLKGEDVTPPPPRRYGTFSRTRRR